MSTFDDRPPEFEGDYAPAAERRLRAEARRTRRLGEWAAGRLGYEGLDAERYVSAVVREEFQPTGADAVLTKLAADLAGLAGRDEIEAQSARLLAETEAEIGDPPRAP